MCGDELDFDDGLYDKLFFSKMRAVWIMHRSTKGDRQTIGSRTKFRAIRRPHIYVYSTEKLVKRHQRCVQGARTHRRAVFDALAAISISVFVRGGRRNHRGEGTLRTRIEGAVLSW